MVVVLVVVGGAFAGVSLSFKGELGKPIQRAHKGGFSVSPARLRRLDFYLPVSRMKLCVSGRYCFTVCIFDLYYCWLGCV